MHPLLIVLLFADVSLPGARAADATDCDERGKQVQATDLNGDGKPDVWKLSLKGKLVCKRVDLNFDGKVDLQVHYAADGTPRLEEYDFDFDGRIDLWRLSQNGKRVCEALALDDSGKPTLWKRYDGDQVTTEKTPTGPCLSLAR